MTIAIDFDGTCVTHEFPMIGKDINAVPVLKELTEKGHYLILFTMRYNVIIDGEQKNYLTDSVKWFVDRKIPLYGIQSNPTQDEWTSSPKAYAQLYIDDAALGCPLIYDKTYSDRPFVDWIRVREMLVERGIL